MRWKRPASVLFWPVSAAVVLGLALLGIGSIENSAASTQTPRAAVQPAILVGSESSATPTALPAVIASVKSAQHGGPIPKPLTPSFAKLQNDWFPYPKRCEVNDVQTHSAICYLSGPGAAPSSKPHAGHKTLVVLGDSHAQMWYPALLAMAKKDNWDVVSLAKAGCVASGLYSNFGASAECHAWLVWARQTIAKIRPNTVFISYHYSGYTDSTTVANTESGLSSLTVWAKTMAKHVVLMADVPNLSSLPMPVDCLQQKGATLKTCTGTWSGSDLDLTGALEAVAKINQVGVMDPLGWFCYQGLCPQAIGHPIAYKDAQHVSKTYATALSPPFRAAFRAALTP